MLSKIPSTNDADISNQGYTVVDMNSQLRAVGRWWKLVDNSNKKIVIPYQETLGAII